MKYFVNDLKPFLSSEDQILGLTDEVYFTNIKPVSGVQKDTLDWINPSKSNRQDLFNSSTAMIIICDKSIIIDQSILTKKCVIVVTDPKLTFLRIANKLFVSKLTPSIHPTAIIHPDAVIAENVYIGPFSYVGKVTIKQGSIIYGHCHLYDNVIIGNNVIINAGCVIGAEGFGYVRNEKNEFEKFPHIGGVVIEDDVEIGSNTSIDRGSLGDTIIRQGAKIDNLVHIAHNVEIGRHSAIIANAMVAGSTKIGDYSWIAPSSSILEQLSTGSNVVVGVGAVVTKNIPDGETWTGSPAKPIKEFIEMQKKIKNL